MRKSRAGSRSSQQVGRIEDRRRAPAVPFARRYTTEDIRLLAEMDALHGTLSGTTTRKLCERAFQVYGDARYERLAGISNGHLYNLRQHKTYRNTRGSFDKTRPAKVNIGERKKPLPAGRCGYLRVDSVHQGDLDGIKGVYPEGINISSTRWMKSLNSRSCARWNVSARRICCRCWRR